MRRYKKIEGTLMINGNQESFCLSFPAETADKLCGLYKTAQETILKDIEEEYQYKFFDKWLKKTEPKLYDAAMAAFMSELHLRLQECFADGDEYCSGIIDAMPPCSMDDGFSWPEDRNEIAIESFIKLIV